METYRLEIPFGDEKAMEEFQKLMDILWDEAEKEAENFAITHGVSIDCARNVLYLRTRSRWTQEKEDYLIWLGQNGKELPDYFDDFEVPENYK